MLRSVGVRMRGRPLDSDEQAVTTTARRSASRIIRRQSRRDFRNEVQLCEMFNALLPLVGEGGGHEQMVGGLREHSRAPRMAFIGHFKRRRRRGGNALHGQMAVGSKNENIG